MISGKVEIVDGISREEFLADHLRVGKPVVVRNSIREWAALRKWTLDYFDRLFGPHEVGLQGGFFGNLESMTFSEYLQIVEQYEQKAVDDFNVERPVPYLRYSEFRTHAHKALQGDWSHPEFLPQGRYVFPLSWRKARPEARIWPEFGVYVSPRGAATTFHVDGGYDNAILCQVLGRKKGILYDPSQETKWSEFFPPGPDGPPIATPKSVALLKNNELETTGDLEGLQFELGPGDVLFIPKRWAHEVYTCEASVSVTYNFLHASDLDSRSIRNVVVGNLYFWLLIPLWRRLKGLGSARRSEVKQNTEDSRGRGDRWA